LIKLYEKIPKKFPKINDLKEIEERKKKEEKRKKKEKKICGINRKKGNVKYIGFYYYYWKKSRLFDIGNTIRNALIVKNGTKYMENSLLEEMVEAYNLIAKLKMQIAYQTDS